WRAADPSPRGRLLRRLRAAQGRPGGRLLARGEEKGMQQTPMHDLPNLALLGLVPAGVERVVEAGCSSGAFGQAYLAQHPDVEYIGIEMAPEYAEVARTRLSEVVVANVEQLED